MQSVTNQLTTSGALSVSCESASEDEVVEPDVGRTPFWKLSKVTALFSVDVDIVEVRKALGVARAIGEIEFVKDEDWVAKWNRENRVRRKFGNIWVVPKDSEEMPDRNVVKLDPGLAFGAGDHPTTALCLRWLELQDLSERSMLDFGCGSGILALVAALRGANPVTAVDHDPQALIATRENAEVNGVAAEVLDAIDPCGHFDVVVSNILANTLIENSQELSAVTNHEGMVALSGILEHQVSSVISAFRGFDFGPPYREGKWALLAGRKRRMRVMD